MSWERHTVTMHRFANRVALVTGASSGIATYITGANLVVDGGRTSCFTACALGTLTA